MPTSEEYTEFFRFNDETMVVKLKAIELNYKLAILQNDLPLFFWSPRWWRTHKELAWAAKMAHVRSDAYSRRRNKMFLEIVKQ